LYDFLYRDSSRITSLYSQIFGGHLTSLEETDSMRDTKDSRARVNIALASGDMKSSEENLSSQKRTTVPHDILATDVLSYFYEQGRVYDDIDTAPNGAIIRAKGTLILVDRTMIEMAIFAFEADLENMRKAARTPDEKATVKNLKSVLPILDKLVFPSGFLLHTDEGLQIAGTLKDAGMEEPISTYYFKHGTAGLSSVHLVGIKEKPTHAFELSNEQLIGAGKIMAQFLHNMTFPPDAIMATPITLLREL
jgi:hypothetical protein